MKKIIFTFLLAIVCFYAQATKIKIYYFLATTCPISQKYTLTINEIAKKFQALGAGEIVVNSIDNDGKMSGYDQKLVRLVRDAVDIPLTVLGGAGSLNDIKAVIDEHKIIGVAAGSLFVFKGTYRAVLINYPSIEDKKLLNKR